jgi:hypothetical protein
MENKYQYNVSAFADLQLQVGSQTKTYSLNIAICADSTLRDFLVHQLEAAYPQIEIISFWPYTDDIFEHVHDQIKPGPHDAVFVSGLDDAIASDQMMDDFYTNLNQSIKRWKAWFACPVVFWISHRTADTLRDEAKDFWEWLEAIYRLEG